MKVFSKVAAIAAALLLVTAFAGCSNAADSDSGNSTVATFEATQTRNGVTFVYTLTCKANKEWEQSQSATSAGQSITRYYGGTYTGDPSQDGTVTFKLTKSKENGSDWQTLPEAQQTEMTGTITNGILTLSNGMTLTRK